jgi:hypothetical protein
MVQNAITKGQAMEEKREIAVESQKAPHPHLAEITVDRIKKTVQAGPYRVSVLKHEVGVPPEKELDQIIKGVIKPLDDNATILIAGGEVFISHERTGAAS